MTQKAGWEVGSSTGLFIPTWSKLIKDSRECAMKQISFRAKVHGRTSFAFWKCQVRPKIRACVKDFFPLAEIWQSTSPAFQHLPWLAQPWFPPEGQVPAFPKLHIPVGTASIHLHPSNCIHPSASIHLHQALGSGRWISRAEREAQNPLLTHRSQRLFTLQIVCFLPRPEHLEEGRAEHSGSCLF